MSQKPLHSFGGGGRGDIAKLPSFSRLQIIVQRLVALENRYKYLVPVCAIEINGQNQSKTSELMGG